MPKARDYVIRPVVEKYTKPQLRFGIKIPEANTGMTMRDLPD
jgi:hypothetical protein